MKINHARGAAIVLSVLFALCSVAWAASVVTASYYIADEGEALGHGWQMRARATPALSFAVPTIQPTDINTPVALDLTPLGTAAVESGGNGFAWFDACDRSVRAATENGPVTCGRVGIKTIDGVRAGYVGTETYNGASWANFYLETNASPRWGVSYNPGHLFPYVDNAVSLGLFNRRITDVYLTDIGSLQAKLADMEARLTALETQPE